MSERAHRSGLGNTELARSRNWCFTNHDGLEIEESIMNIYNINYVIYQLEACPKTMKLHYQGYVQLNSAYGLSHMKSILPKAHWEISRGSATQNILYCSKEDSRIDGPWIFGNIRCQQGKRSDLLALRDAISNGTSIIDMINEDDLAPQVFRYLKNVRSIQELYEVPRTWPMEIFVFYGTSGCGKSRAVWDLMNATEEKIYVKDVSNEWWENYEGEPNVLLDDFDGSVFKRSYLLQLMDRYPMRINIKGRSAMFRSKRLFITTNFHPSEWYKKSDAIMRRITEFGLLYDFNTDTIV